MDRLENIGAHDTRGFSRKRCVLSVLSDGSRNMKETGCFKKFPVSLTKETLYERKRQMQDHTHGVVFSVTLLFA